MGLLAPRPREGRCRTPFPIPLQKDSVLLKPAKGGACTLAIPLWKPPEILVGVFGCSSAVQGGGVDIKSLVLWRLTYCFAGRPSAEVFVNMRGFMAIPPYGRSKPQKSFFYASWHNKDFRPKGRQVSTNIGELYRFTQSLSK